MKLNITAALFFVLMSVWSFGQGTHMQKVKSSIDEVTVFLTGGEIVRSSEVNLKAGRNKLVYTGISTVIDQKSIQFYTKEGVSLVSVSTALDYMNLAEGNPQINVLNDSLKQYKWQRTEWTNERDAYRSEKELLKSNISIKGSQQNLSAEELKTMAVYYRERMMVLNKTISSYDSKLVELNTKMNQIRQQLSALNYTEKNHSNQIVVIVDVSSEMMVNTTLKYVISNCGWQANYDLSANGGSTAVTLKYKAKVYNNTGNDWEKVNLILSTANPNLSATAPVLDAWFLNNRTISKSFRQKNTVLVPQNRGYDKYYQNASVPQMSQNIEGVAIRADERGEGTANVNIRTIEVPQISTEFDISKPYTIPSNSKPYLVEINAFELNASFSHKAVPKLDKDAFLLANIVGWEDLNLISGPTHVYYAGTYVGQSYIDTRNVEDTLNLSLGRDNKVIVSRKLLEEFSSTKVIGANKKDTYTYEITVKNNQTMTLKMNLYDQVPISQESDISVSVDEISGAAQNEETGILSWGVNLQPGGMKKYRVSFTIKYPKDKVITVKRFRTVSCPSF